MLRHVPAEGAADTPRRRAGNQADHQADQSEADTKPSPSNQELTRSPWTPITAEPAFSSLYGSPSRAVKHFPTLSDSTDSPADSLYPADSLCFADPPRSLAYPPPGVLPESDCPIKGPDQWSIGVAPSSRGVSYIHPKGGSDMWKQGATLIGSQVHYFMCTEPAPCLGQVLVYRRIKTLAK